MKTKTIRNVSDESWNLFKSMARQQNIDLSELFERLVKQTLTIQIIPARDFQELLESLRKKPLFTHEQARIAKKCAAEMRRNF
jgi:hypothetical protein